MPVVVRVVLVVLVVAPLILALQLGRDGPRPHRLPVGVSAPTLVAQDLAARADALPGEPFAAVALPPDDDPAAPVRAGALPVTVAVDFRTDRDQLFVSATTDPDLVREVRVRLEAISSTYGRELAVVVVPPERGADVARAAPYALVGAWTLLGVLLSVGLSWWRGPVATTARESLVRFGLLASAGLVGGLLVAVVAGAWVGTPMVPLVLVGAGAVAATAWLVLGAEALYGLVGLGVAVSWALGTLAPLLARTDPAALPRPWSDLAPWTVPGAALSLTRAAVFTSTGPPLRSVVVLVSWILLALLVLAVARTQRPAGPT